MLRPMAGRTFALLIWLAGCGFQASSQNAADDAQQTQPPDASSPDASSPDARIDPRIDASIDASPDALTCSDLTCDPNATCDDAAPACKCKTGYDGTGATCADVDECATNNGGCAAACQNTIGNFVCYAPASCADLKSHGKTTDGTYTLYLNTDAAKPWAAFCADMATTPREYISVNASNTGNYSTGGRATGAVDVTTTYSKIRFDPATMLVDIADRKFATSTGTVMHPISGGPPVLVTSMPYAVAMDCRGNNSMTGQASIDLTGTSFAVATGQVFAHAGNQDNGSINPSSQNRRVQINGGGNCGWEGPNGLPSNPFNDNVTNGKLLKLTYLP
jgi:hypothetical protein